MARVEIRDYEGDFEDLAELSRRVWIPEYAGKIWVPLPDASFLRWRFSPASGAICVVAYEDDRLMGSVFSTPHTLRVGQTAFPIALYTGFSVDPQTRRVALPLIERLRRKNQERGVALGLGMILDDKRSASYRFWTKYAEAFPQNFYLLFRGGYWVKFLKPAKLAKAGVEAWERLAARLLGPLLRYTPHGVDPDVRLYRPADLDWCMEMLKKNSAGFDWTLVWRPEQLGAQLENPVYRTLLIERDHQPRAMVNYHGFTLQGRETVRIALIDVWAEDSNITHRERVRLISHLCIDLIERGFDGVVTPRSAMVPRLALLSNHFMPSDQHFQMGVFPTPGLDRLEAPKTWSLEIT